MSPSIRGCTSLGNLSEGRGTALEIPSVVLGTYQLTPTTMSNTYHGNLFKGPDIIPSFPSREKSISPSSQFIVTDTCPSFPSRVHHTFDPSF